MSIVLAVLEKYKLPYKLVKNGKELLLRCPFPDHKDRSPSLYIEKSTGKFHCFGCKVGGLSMESFVKKLTGQSVNLSEFITPGDLFQFQMNQIYEQSSDNISGLTTAFYRSEEILAIYNTFDDVTIHSEAMDYLTGPRRKLTLDTIKKFRLRFCTNGEFMNRIIVPYFRGNTLIGFNGRLLGTDKEIGKEMRYRYLLNQPLFDDYIFNLDHAIGVETCILVEGPFDLMYTEQCGFKNVISTLSTRVSINHISTLSKFKKYIFLFDNDVKKSGEKAMMEAAKLLLNSLHGRSVFYAKLPDYKDPNEASPEELKNSFRAIRRIKLEDPKIEHSWMFGLTGS